MQLKKDPWSSFEVLSFLSPTCQPTRPPESWMSKQWKFHNLSKIGGKKYVSARQNTICPIGDKESAQNISLAVKAPQRYVLGARTPDRMLNNL